MDKKIFAFLETLRDKPHTLKLSFYKMNGAGNDFVMLDNRTDTLKLSKDQIQLICDRHRGVGGDGLLLVEPSNQGDFRMRYYNSDGSEAEMCGNGARCFARFVQKLGACDDTVTFQTPAGLIRAKINGPLVQINLSEPTGLRLKEKIKLQSGEIEVHSLNTGVPHAVLIVPNADDAFVQPIGAEIRYHPHFAPKGTNVNFVQLLSKNSLRVRTYERGVEGETLACGTGVTASALLVHALYQMHSPITVQVQGGDLLNVSFKSDGICFREVFLEGPADFTFEGAMVLPKN